MKKIINNGLKKHIEDRKIENKKKILKAIESLSNDSKKITMQNIADIIGMTRVNLYIYKDFIEENKKKFEEEINKPEKKKNKTIKFKNEGLRQYEEKRRCQKEKKILEAIIKLKETSEKITMQKIADLINVSRPSLYIYKKFIDLNKN